MWIYYCISGLHSFPCCTGYKSMSSERKPCCYTHGLDVMHRIEKKRKENDKLRIAILYNIQFMSLSRLTEHFAPKLQVYLLLPEFSKSRMRSRAFSYQAPLLWNKLPVNVREADTLSTFKIRLITFLFDKAYS